MKAIVIAGALLGSVIDCAAAAERPVVVELFTSEGCSSCPPADALLTAMKDRRDVLPLAFHVTYWDRLGWKDPFGLTAATERQANYAARFGDGSYTPELVVEGRRGVVGSDRAAVEAALAAARQAGGTEADVAVTRRGATLSISVAAGHGSGRILLVGFDPEHRTSVGRGENTGRTLIESNIVRSIRVVGHWAGTAVTVSNPVPEGLDTAVLVEAPDGAIIGAARAADAS